MDHFARLKEVVVAAIDLPAERRVAYVDEACGDDEELRSDVLAKLAHLAKDPSLLRTGGVQPIARDLVAEPGPTRLGNDSAGAGRDLTGSQVSHYAIERKLGTGGMGEVFLARDLALDRPVALKLLPRGFHPAVRHRLLREAWASARVQHPGIATFYDAGHAAGVDYIATEYVAGTTLQEHLDGKALPTQPALALTDAMLEALVHAHFSGILHRDIKPANIMVTPDERPKLLDFGLARGLLPEAAEASSDGSDGVSSLADGNDGGEAGATLLAAAESEGELPGLTRAGTVMGTPGYLPPEQVRGETVDERADVFAVGAVLYQMLSGRLAFPGRTTSERVRAILERDPGPIEGLSPELGALILRSLDRDRTRRPSSAAAFLSELRAVGGHQSARAAHTITLGIRDFRNESGDNDGDWIASAVPEAAALQLTGLAGLTVVPRERVLKAAADTAAGPPSDATLGLRVGCSAVLSGTIKSIRPLVVTARVTDVATGDPVLIDTLRAELEEIHELEGRIAQLVAANVGAEPPRSSGSNVALDAYEDYARARRLLYGMNRNDFEEARKLLEAVVNRDPRFARAFAKLGQLDAFTYNFTRNPEALRTAESHIARALALDPDLGEAYLWRGYILQNREVIADTYRAYRRAHELEPENSWAAYFCSGPLIQSMPHSVATELADAIHGAGAPAADPHDALRHEAVRLLQTAIRLGPSLAWAWVALGFAHMDLGRGKEAVWCFERAVALQDRAVPPMVGVEGFLGECRRRFGDPAAARECFLRALDALERTDHMYRDTWRGAFLCGLGRAALDLGDESAALASFRQAALHVRGRSAARCSGHILVQALAGLTQAGGGAESFHEATNLHRDRRGFDFFSLWSIHEGSDLLELSRAARTLGDRDTAEALLSRALDYGSREARDEAAALNST